MIHKKTIRSMIQFKNQLKIISHVLNFNVTDFESIFFAAKIMMMTNDETLTCSVVFFQLFANIHNKGFVYLLNKDVQPPIQRHSV